MFLGHRLITGKTGSGKTNYLLTELLSLVYQGEHWITAIFPHSEAGKKFVAELYGQFGDWILDRLVVEQLSDTDSVVMRRFIDSSDSDDYFERMREHDETVTAGQDLFARQRELPNLHDHVSLDEVSNIAFNVILNQREPIAESFYPYLLDRKHPVSREAKRNLREDCEELLDQYEQILSVPPAEAKFTTKPVARMFRKNWWNGVMLSRTSQPQIWDKRAFHNKGGIFIILGDNVSPDVLRTYVLFDFLQTSRWARKGLIGPGVYAVDEATNYGLIGDFEARQAATLRFTGMACWWLLQTYAFPTPKIEQSIIGNTDLYAFKQSGEMAHKSAQSLLGILDEHKVHHTTKKRIDREPKREKRKTKTTTSNNQGGSMSESESEQLIPDFFYEDENAYQSGHEQVLFLARNLQVQPVGQYHYTSSLHGSGIAQAELFGDSWAFPGLAQAKFDECLQKIKTSAIYQKPTRTRFLPGGESPQQTPMQQGAKKQR